MTASSKPDRRSNPIGLVGEIDKLKRQRAQAGALPPHIAALREWQGDRLRRSYADLLAHSRYAPACRFFLDDIYAARDFSQRDTDIKQMHDFMHRFLPAQMIRPLTLTVQLHALTEKLDVDLCDMIFDQLKLSGPITLAVYADAYRRCDNYAARKQQIDWINEIGQELDRIVRQSLTGTVLSLAAGPARRAGWDELTGFLERGYKAFRHLHGARAFLETVCKRETRFLDRIYAGQADPYGLGSDETLQGADDASL